MITLDFLKDLADVLKKHGIKNMEPMFCLNCCKECYYDGTDRYAHIRIRDNGTLEIIGMKIDPIKGGNEYE